MPPKSKKEQEEEALRLLQQQKKKEQEQARLAIERQKYAGQTIATKLLLPASNQLVIDISFKSAAFVTEKLISAIKQAYPSLGDHKLLQNMVVRQLIFYLIQAKKIFKIENVTEVIGHESDLLKARVIAGIALKLMLNEHPVLGGKGKSKKNDEELFKQILRLHVQAGQDKIKLFNLKQLQAVVRSINGGYFRHFLMLQHYNQFNVRYDQQEAHIYVAAPATIYNSKDTPFIDLSQQNNPPANKES